MGRGAGDENSRENLNADVIHPALSTDSSPEINSLWPQSLNSWEPRLMIIFNEIHGSGRRHGVSAMNKALR